MYKKPSIYKLTASFFYASFANLSLSNLAISSSVGICEKVVLHFG